MLQLEFAFASDRGDVRPTNQDRLFAKVGIINDVSCGLFCVADGMGGLSNGHIAASISAETIENWWEARLLQLAAKDVAIGIIYEELTSLFYFINSQILVQSCEDGSKAGTTCSVLLIIGDTYFIAHAGDTRIYATQKKLISGSRIIQLTEDHTWLAEQIRRGGMAEEELLKHPKRNMLTSCLGVFEYPKVFTSAGLIDKNSVFILASDGLYRNITEQEMAKLSTRFSNVTDLASELIKMSSERIATDNVSVVAVRCVA